MSNRAVIQFREFVELGDDLEKQPMFGESSYYGFVVHDDYDSTYTTIGTKTQMFQEMEKYGSEPLVRAIGIVLEYQSDASENILSSVLENERGITVNGTYYEYEEIQTAYQKVLNIHQRQGPITKS